MFTEGCMEILVGNRYNDWSMGEQYGINMINDFNNGRLALQTGIFYWMKQAGQIMYRIFVLHRCMQRQKKVRCITPTPIITSVIFQNSSSQVRKELSVLQTGFNYSLPLLRTRTENFQ